MAFTVKLPTRVVLDVDTESEALWALARHFGCLADGQVPDVLEDLKVVVTDDNVVEE